MFTIILPTYKRPDLVLRSVESVLSQQYTQWQLIIIVDDPTSDYTKLQNRIANIPNVRIIQNETNCGKNASVNKALALLQTEKFDGHIVFLDDDDWLASDCLHTFTQQQKTQWIVSSRFDTNHNRSLTISKKKSNLIHYTKDMLFMRRFYGETTHCIYFPPVAHVRFPILLKNAEEWLYFAQIATTYPTFTYVPVRGTLTEGYLPDGLSVTTQTRSNKLAILRQLLTEVRMRKLLSPYIYLYLLGRTLKTVIKG